MNWKLNELKGGFLAYAIAIRGFLGEVWEVLNQEYKMELGSQREEASMVGVKLNYASIGT